MCSDMTILLVHGGGKVWYNTSALQNAAKKNKSSKGIHSLDTIGRNSLL